MKQKALLGITVTCAIITIIGLIWFNSSPNDRMPPDGLYTFQHKSYYAYGTGEAIGIDIDLVYINNESATESEKISKYSDFEFICEDGTVLGSSLPSDAVEHFSTAKDENGNVQKVYKYIAHFLLNGFDPKEGEKKITTLTFKNENGTGHRLNLGAIGVEFIQTDPKDSIIIENSRYYWWTSEYPIMKTASYMIENQTNADIIITEFDYGSGDITPLFNGKTIPVAKGKYLEVTCNVNAVNHLDGPIAVYVFKPKYTYSTNGETKSGVFSSTSYTCYLNDIDMDIREYLYNLYK